MSIIAVGRKGRDFMIRYGQDVKAIFVDVGDRPSLADTIAFSRMVVDDYTDGSADEVYMSYVEFVSTTVQLPVVKRLLPIIPAELSAAEMVGLHLRAQQPDGAGFSASQICGDASFTMHYWN